jgi:ATP adenylyltransferase
MDYLSSPWRMKYIRGESRSAPDGGCLFCSIGRIGVSRDSLVLYQGSLCFVVMNAYPYTSGHMMVVPNAHGGSLQSHSPDALREMTDLLRECERILIEEYKPAGLNLGINIGKSAGAGIQEHLHAHILPRWDGDTNFMTTVHEVRVLPEDLVMTYDRLLPHFAGIASGRPA